MMMAKLLHSARALVAGALALSAVGAAAQTVFVARSVNAQLRDAVVIAGLTAAAVSQPCYPSRGCNPANAFNTSYIPAMYSANKTRAASGQTPYTYDQAGYTAYQANGYQ